MITAITSAGTGTYTVNASVGGCASPNSTVAVVINQTPVAPIAGSNTPVCSGQTLSLTASSTGTTYTWSGPNSFSAVTQNPTVAAVTTAAGGTYSVTTTTSGCTSPLATTSVVVNQTPSAPVAGSNSPICSGQTLSLTASTVAAAIYNWSGPNSFTSTSQNPTIAGATSAAAGTYSISVSVSGCTGPAGTTAVTTNTTPVPTPGSNSPVCQGNTLSLTANTVAGATYAWSGPNSFSSASQIRPSEQLRQQNPDLIHLLLLRGSDVQALRQPLLLRSHLLFP